MGERVSKEEEIKRLQKMREDRAREKTAGLDPEQLDFDPEEDDETMLRLKALETQAKKLIPNYGSPPRPRSSSEDSSNLPSTSRKGKEDESSESDDDDKDVKRKRKEESRS